jgi:hypothetical protein
MLYELRIYECAPGRLPALHERFRTVTTRKFAQYGIRVLGYWTDKFGESDRLTYLVQWADEAERDRKWGAPSRPTRNGSPLAPPHEPPRPYGTAPIAKFRRTFAASVPDERSGPAVRGSLGGPLVATGEPVEVVGCPPPPRSARPGWPPWSCRPAPSCGSPAGRRSAWCA